MMKMSGRVLFASLLALAVSTTAWADEEKKPEEKKEAAPAGPAEFKPKTEIKAWHKGCMKEAKDKTSKRECKNKRRELEKAHKAKLREAKMKANDAKKKAKMGMRSCKKDKACKAKFKD